MTAPNPESFAAFRARRQAQQERLMETTHRDMKRFLRLDVAAFEDGALDGRTKELLGLVASMVLRCNECIDFHVEQCVKAGYSNEELEDAMNVGLLIGGSIVIPHLRHALASLDELRAEEGEES